MREAEVWRTLKPFHPSLMSPSGFTNASAAPSPPAASAPGPTITAGRSALANASVTSLGSLPSSFRSSPSQWTFIPRSTSGPMANTLPPLRTTLRSRVAISGASQRMLEPTSSTASALSIPAMVELNATARRLLVSYVSPVCRPSSRFDPCPSSSFFAAYIVSASSRSPAIAATFAPAFLSRLANTCSASGQLASLELAASPAPTAGRAGCAPAHRHGGASCRKSTPRSRPR